MMIYSLIQFPIVLLFVWGLNQLSRLSRRDFFLIALLCWFPIFIFNLKILRLEPFLYFALSAFYGGFVAALVWWRSNTSPLKKNLAISLTLLFCIFGHILVTLLSALFAVGLFNLKR